MHTTFTKPRSTPWEHTSGVDQVLEQWRHERRVWSNVVLDELLEGTTAKTAPIPETMDARLKAALHARGMTSLYTHQAKAFELATSGRDFVVVRDGFPPCSPGNTTRILPFRASVIGVSMSMGAASRPSTSARYFFFASPASKAIDAVRCASAVVANKTTPDVSRSMR